MELDLAAGSLDMLLAALSWGEELCSGTSQLPCYSGESNAGWRSEESVKCNLSCSSTVHWESRSCVLTEAGNYRRELESNWYFGDLDWQPMPCAERQHARHKWKLGLGFFFIFLGGGCVYIYNPKCESQTLLLKSCLCWD